MGVKGDRRIRTDFHGSALRAGGLWFARVTCRIRLGMRMGAS